jgi:hypothetical protein
MSRVDSSRIAVWKAGEAKLSLKGSVVCSDAFFPFPDGLIAAAEAGATAAIQPGGSVKDSEVIAAADERGMAMAFTGRAAFPALNWQVFYSSENEEVDVENQQEPGPAQLAERDGGRSAQTKNSRSAGRAAGRRRARIEIWRSRW